MKWRPESMLMTRTKTSEYSSASYTTKTNGSRAPCLYFQTDLRI